MVSTDGTRRAVLPRAGVSACPPTGWGRSRRSGAGSVAFVIDIVLSALVAWLITAPEPPQNTSLLVWAVMTVVTVGLFGITPGQAVLGIRVVPIGGGSLVGAWAIPTDGADLRDHAAAAGQR